MAEYRDFWREFRLIQETTKKKLLKRPNYENAIAQLRQLSADMEEAEMPEHVAACQRQMASYYEKLQNFPLELHHLLAASKYYFTARMLRHSLHIAVMHESEALMEECYLSVIEKCIKQGLVKLAAASAIETAEHFLKFHNTARAYYYFLKASRFAQNDVYFSMNILEKLCRIAEKSPLDTQDEMLMEIQTIWTNLLKDMSFSGVIREMLTKVEFHLLLLNLRFARETHDWQRPLLLQYGEMSLWQSGKLSVMTRDEFTKVARFIDSIQAGSHTLASRQLTFDLPKLLNDNTKEFTLTIVSALDNDRVVDRGFHEILHSIDCSELDKRQKLFELYNTLTRKNQANLEFL